MRYLIVLTVVVSLAFGGVAWGQLGAGPDPGGGEPSDKPAVSTEPFFTRVWNAIKDFLGFGSSIFVSLTLLEEIQDAVDTAADNLKQAAEQLETQDPKATEQALASITEAESELKLASIALAQADENKVTDDLSEKIGQAVAGVTEALAVITTTGGAAVLQQAQQGINDINKEIKETIAAQAKVQTKALNEINRTRQAASGAIVEVKDALDQSRADQITDDQITRGDVEVLVFTRVGPDDSVTEAIEKYNKALAKNELSPDADVYAKFSGLDAVVQMAFTPINPATDLNIQVASIEADLEEAEEAVNQAGAALEEFAVEIINVVLLPVKEVITFINTLIIPFTNYANFREKIADVFVGTNLDKTKLTLTAEGFVVADGKQYKVKGVVGEQEVISDQLRQVIFQLSDLANELLNILMKATSGELTLTVTGVGVAGGNSGFVAAADQNQVNQAVGVISWPFQSEQERLDLAEGKYIKLTGIGPVLIEIFVYSNGNLVKKFEVDAVIKEGGQQLKIPQLKDLGIGAGLLIAKVQNFSAGGGGLAASKEQPISCGARGGIHTSTVTVNNQSRIIHVKGLNNPKRDTVEELFAGLKNGVITQAGFDKEIQKIDPSWESDFDFCADMHPPTNPANCSQFTKMDKSVCVQAGTTDYSEQFTGLNRLLEGLITYCAVSATYFCDP